VTWRILCPAGARVDGGGQSAAILPCLCFECTCADASWLDAAAGPGEARACGAEAGGGREPCLPTPSGQAQAGGGAAARKHGRGGGQALEALSGWHLRGCARHRGAGRHTTTHARTHPCSPMPPSPPQAEALHAGLVAEERAELEAEAAQLVESRRSFETQRAQALQSLRAGVLAFIADLELRHAIGANGC
jgi:hypothetical protein